MALQILITCNGNVIDVVANNYYEAQSLKGTKVVGGERDTFSFVLVNPPTSGSGMVIPASDGTGYAKGGTEQQVVIKDTTANPVKVLFKGRIRRPSVATQATDSSGNYINKYTVECSSFDRDLDRLIVDEQYENEATGWIVRDIITRYCNNTPVGYTPFNATNVVTTSPPCTMLPYYDTSNQKPTQIFDYLASVEGWEWYLDTDGSVYFNSSTEGAAPFSITDSDVDDVTGSTLTLEYDSTNLFNVGILNYKRVYNDGYCRLGMQAYTDLSGNNIAATDAYQIPSGNINIITGYGTNWGSLSIPTAVQSALGGDGSMAVFSLAGWPDQSAIAQYWPIGSFGNGYPYEVLQLTSAFSTTYTGPAEGPITEPDGTVLSNLPYQITGIPSQTAYIDTASVAALKAIRGDDGMQEKVLSDSRSFTFDEAQQYAKAQVLGNSNPVINIKYTTNSNKVPQYFRPGQWVTFTLTKRFTLNTTLAIKQIEIKDLGALDDDGTILLQYRISFETRLYSFSKKIASFDAIAENRDQALSQGGQSLRWVLEETGVTETLTPPASNERMYPFVAGPSIREWAVGTPAGSGVTGLDFNTGTLTNTVESGGVLQISPGQSSGTWQSGWQSVTSTNCSKTFSSVQATPTGCTISWAFRAATDNLGTNATAWYTDATYGSATAALQAVPMDVLVSGAQMQLRCLQIRATLTAPGPVSDGSLYVIDSTAGLTKIDAGTGTGTVIDATIKSGYLLYDPSGNQYITDSNQSILKNGVVVVDNTGSSKWTNLQGLAWGSDNNLYVSALVVGSYVFNKIDTSTWAVTQLYNFTTNGYGPTSVTTDNSGNFLLGTTTSGIIKMPSAGTSATVLVSYAAIGSVQVQGVTYSSYFYLVAVTNATVYSVTSGGTLATLAANSISGNFVAANPDGTVYVSGGRPVEKIALGSGTMSSFFSNGVDNFFACQFIPIAANTPTVTSCQYTPDKQVLVTNQGTVGAVNNINIPTPTAWTTGANSQTDTATVPGQVQLAQSSPGVYYTNGTWTSQWMSLPAAFTRLSDPTITESTPASTTATVSWRTSPDATVASATAWQTWQHPIPFPDDAFIQIQVSLATSNTAVTPNVSAIQLSAS